MADEKSGKVFLRILGYLTTLTGFLFAACVQVTKLHARRSKYTTGKRDLPWVGPWGLI
jgi:hypothetical protein